MAAINIPRGQVVDFLALGALFKVLEGPNLQRAGDNFGQINDPDGPMFQEDCSRRKVSGTIKAAAIDGTAVLPEGGENWDITGATGAPYTVKVDSVNDEGETEDGYYMHSIAFHYWEEVTDKTLTAVTQLTGV